MEETWIDFDDTFTPRINTLYIEESILFSNTSVETHSVKLWHNISDIVHFSCITSDINC